MRRAGVRPSVRMSVRLSSHAAYRLSIDICRRQRAAAASVLDCDPTDKDRQTCLARPAAESKSAGRGLYVLLLFFFNFIFFYDYCQTNYLKIYQTDRRQIFRVGR